MLLFQLSHFFPNSFNLACSTLQILLISLNLRIFDRHRLFGSFKFFFSLLQRIKNILVLFLQSFHLLRIFEHLILLLKKLFSLLFKFLLDLVFLIFNISISFFQNLNLLLFFFLDLSNLLFQIFDLILFVVYVHPQFKLILGHLLPNLKNSLISLLYS